MNSVAVIGAGITGLTVAFRLQQQRIPVAIYEASGRAGGVIQSIRQDGYLAEFGPNTILETSPKIAQLVQDLDLAERRWYSEDRAGKRFLCRGHKLMEVPDSPPKFFTSPLFSAGAKLRLLREPFVKKGTAEDESVADLVLRRLGREFLDYAINPLVAGIYAGDPARLSVLHAFPKLYAIEQRYGSLILGQILGARERKKRAEVSKQNAKKVSFDEGLQVLTDRLAELLKNQIYYNTPVQTLRQKEQGWEVVAKTPAGEKTFAHSAVVYTGTAYKLPAIETASGAPLSSPLSEIIYPPVTSVVLGFRREDVAHPLDGFGVLVPQVENLHVLGTIFSSSLFPNRAPAGHVTLTSYIGGTRAPELAERTADELVDMCVADLRILLGVKGAPTFRHHIFYPRAIPQYNVGYGKYKSWLDQAETKLPGLFFAGHFRDGVSMGDSIVSAFNAGDRLAAFAQQVAKPEGAVQGQAA